MPPYDDVSRCDVPATQGGAGELLNPLSSPDILCFFVKIMDIILVFALPIIVFFIMYGGYMLVTAQGESGKIESGRNTILWAIIGGVIIFGAELILMIISRTVETL
jgi:hypothetical protein